MRLDAVRFQALQSVPVTVTGSWRSERRRAGSHWWKGSATSSGALVGMSFLQARNAVGWCKSERDETSPEVRFGFEPYDDKDVLDVCAFISVGLGQEQFRTTLLSPTFRPALPDTLSLQTGTIYRLAELEANPAVSLYCLFIAREDVESSRKALWRVRRRLEEGLPQPFRRWLTYGRKGESEG